MKTKKETTAKMDKAEITYTLTHTNNENKNKMKINMQKKNMKNDMIKETKSM